MKLRVLDIANNVKFVLFRALCLELDNFHMCLSFHTVFNFI